MTRLQKALLISVSVVVVLTLSLTLFLHLYLTDDRLRGIAEPFLEEQLGREVSIGGFEIKFFRSLPNLSVGITDLAIHSPSYDDRPAQDLASVRRLWVQLPVLPILQGEIDIKALELDEPQILVEVYDDLSTNLIELGDAEVDSVSNESSASSQTNIVLENIRIRDGQVGYIHADGTLLTLAGLNADLSARLSDLAALDGQLTIQDTYFETGGVTYADHWALGLDVLAESHLDSAWLRIGRANLAIQDLVLELTGQVNNFYSDTIKVDMAFNTLDAPVSSFWSLLPSVLVKDLNGLESDGVFSVQGSLLGDVAEGSLPDLNTNFRIDGGAVRYPGLPSSIQEISLDASLSNSELLVRSFTAKADGAQLRTSAKVSDFAQPVVEADVDLEIDLASIDTYYPLEDSTEIAGNLIVDTQFNGLLEDVNNLNVSGLINLASVDYQSALLEKPINDLNGQIALGNNQIRFERISLITGQSDVKFDGVLTGYEAFFADSLSSLPDPLITGEIASSYLNLTEQISEDTTSSFVGPLELPPVQLNIGLDIEELEFNGLAFSNAEGVLSMTEGVMGFDGISARFFNGLLSASGNFDLSDPLSPAFNGGVALSQMPVAEFFSAFSDMDAIVNLGNYLQGLFDTEASFGLTLDKDLNPQYETVVASGAFGARQGSFGTIPLQSVVAKYTGVTALESLDVRDWTHAFSISGERLHVQDLRFEAGEYSLTLSGFQDFNGGLDYRFSVELPESASNVLAGAPVQGALSSVTSVVNTALKDPQSGRITLDLLASGTFSEPSVKLDGENMKARLTSSLTESLRTKAGAQVDSLQESARARAEAELAEQRQRLEERAEEGVEKLVGELVDSSIVSSPIDSLKEKGANALQDRLKGLLNRRKRNN